MPVAATNPESKSRLPGIDGLRAIAILMVVIHHCNYLPAFPYSKAFHDVASTGLIEGVTVFFALSGYLITWLLLKEETKTGTISLPGFYFRRAVRILPASFLYLGLITVTALLRHWPVSAHEILASVFFFRNLTSGSDHTGHYWSLATEEQYYLFWPFLLRLLPSRWRVPVAAGLFLLAPAARALAPWLGTWAVELQWWRIFRGNAIILGSLLALWLHRRPVKLRWPGWTFGAGALLFTAAVVLPAEGMARWRLVLYAALMAGLALMLRALVTGQCGRLQQVLEARPLVYVGHLSYSLYLWQQPFCLPITGEAHETFPWNLGLAFGCAMFSYHCVEQPCLRRRERWQAAVIAFLKRHRVGSVG